jgi:NAD(P)-dependent dehydrogenase (short-subunit alcohol dehydrogenase family)
LHPRSDKLGLKGDDLKAVSSLIKGMVPQGRFGEPSEVAKEILFLASDESRFTVGADILIDGGMSL